MVYTDGAHLVADSLIELCEYAGKIGLNHEWLQLRGYNIHPHLDICGKVKQRVLEDEFVTKVTPKEIVRICRLNYRPPQTTEEITEWENYHGKKIDEMYQPSENDYGRMISNIFKRSNLERKK